MPEGRFEISQPELDSATCDNIVRLLGRTILEESKAESSLRDNLGMAGDAAADHVRVRDQKRAYVQGMTYILEIALPLSSGKHWDEAVVELLTENHQLVETERYAKVVEQFKSHVASVVDEPSVF